MMKATTYPYTTTNNNNNNNAFDGSTMATFVPVVNNSTSVPQFVYSNQGAGVMPQFGYSVNNNNFGATAAMVPPYGYVVTNPYPPMDGSVGGGTYYVASMNPNMNQNNNNFN